MNAAETRAPAALRPVIPVGLTPLGVADILAIARGERGVALDPHPTCRQRIARSAAMLAELVAADAAVYGVTTGVGASVGTRIPPQQAERFPLNIIRFHGCGTGDILGETEAAAVVAVRLASIARGYGGVREEVIERLCAMINRRVLPRIPSLGSVGASGDLTPLSYVAATLVGEREVTYEGRVTTAAEALAACGLAPLVLLPKESLALMNGTSVTTALACVAWERARRLARLAAALTAVVSEVIRGNPDHFHPRIFELKPHPGQSTVARWIREDLAFDRVRDGDGAARGVERLQDRYSVRCAPHVIGVLVDALASARGVLEVEINSINDNPILDPDTGCVLHGGNFYGGHVGFAMDGLKAAVAGVADLLDRQLVLLCDPLTSGGLPPNLVAATGPERVIHHGFKAVSIAASALTAEALKLTMPASAFSRSTESHNQDKVPMAPIAARDCLSVLDLTETVAAMSALAACQAVDLRGPESCPPRARALHDALRRRVPTVDADRRMDEDIAVVLDLLRADELPLGDASLS